MDVFPTGSPETWWIKLQGFWEVPGIPFLKSQNLALTGEKGAFQDQDYDRLYNGFCELLLVNYIHNALVQSNTHIEAYYISYILSFFPAVIFHDSGRIKAFSEGTNFFQNNQRAS